MEMLDRIQARICAMNKHCFHFISVLETIKGQNTVNDLVLKIIN